MTLEERRLLEAFLADLMRVPAIQKDRAAAAAIDSAFERQPNAAYLVVQRALLLQQALEAAQAETARLRELCGEPAADASSFLADPVVWRGASAPMTAERHGLAGSFVGQAVATAAGVAGGAFLFHGLHDLLGLAPAASAPGDPATGLASLEEGGWLEDAPGVDAGDLPL
jgi:hypothetical protein